MTKHTGMGVGGKTEKDPCSGMETVARGQVGMSLRYTVGKEEN